MQVDNVYIIYFSPVGHTRRVAETLGYALAERLGVPAFSMDMTKPAKRRETMSFAPSDVVLLAVPTYAGRVPNKLLPDLKACFRGDQTPAVAIVTFGNRNFDSSLTELRDVLEDDGFCVTAAAACACGHVFSKRIMPNRPDGTDQEQLVEMARQMAVKIKSVRSAAACPRPVIRGDAPVGPYYTPLKADGTPAHFLKAKPLTEEDQCDRCGLCVTACPMGAIDRRNPLNVPGTCIKCQACIAICPHGAKYFDDADFFSHVAYLEEHCQARQENEWFL